MNNPIEDLSNQITQLQASIINNPLFYKSIENAELEIWTNLDSPHLITSLTRFHALLNNENNINYFNQLKKRKLIEEINFSILRMTQEFIAKRYNVSVLAKPQKAKQSTSPKVAIFMAITFLGTIFTAMDGAYLVQSFLSSFSILTSIPNIILIPTQILFAGIAVLTFYGFQLNAIGKPLGIRAFDLGRIFKLYARQSTAYEETFSLLKSALVNNFLDREELAFFEKTYYQISASYESFDKKISEAKNVQASFSKPKTAVKAGYTAVAAIVCGTIGALGAQTFFSAYLPLILGASLAAGPVGVGITVGLVGLCFIFAASLYVCLQHKAVDELVNKAWGTPTKSVEHLVHKDKSIKYTNREVCKLIARNEENLNIHEKNELLEKENLRLKRIPTAELQNFETWRQQAKNQNQANSTTTSNNPNRLTYTQAEPVISSEETVRQEITVS